MNSVKQKTHSYLKVFREGLGIISLGIFGLNSAKIILGFFEEIISFIKEHRPNMRDFDIVASVSTIGIDSQKREELLSEYIDVGATWLVESIYESTDKTACFDFIEQGPPEI